MKEVLIIMFKKSNKIKSTVLSGIMAASAVVAPLTTAVVPSMTASAANDNYAKLLQYSLYFYDANMCGSDVGETSALSWRDDCHTSDEVTGGFHDAGDHAMFGLPQGYAASTLGWSYYEFADAYNATGQAAHLKKITDHFCEFFKKSTKLSGNSVSNFLYQKESGITDHEYWGAPEAQTGKRKMYWTSNGASDIAAEYAAALAFNYINFGNDEDLKYAEALYKFSTQYNQVATDGPIENGQSFYKNSSCSDEQAWAAAALYHATNNASYLSDAKSKVTQYLGWVHGWENVDLGAACLIAEADGDWSKVNNWIGQTTKDKTQNGYYFLDEWGSARLNCSMQFTALVASKHSNADYTSWVKGQMDYITGNNPSGYSFVIGIGDKYPQNPHHRAASGYASYDEMGDNTTAKAGSPTLVGALVGGPRNSSGSYQDTIKDYVCNEVALDYNAGLVGAAAGLYSVYKTGTPDNSIVGVGAVEQGSVETTPRVTTITTSTPTPVVTTTTQGNTSSASGGYTISPNMNYVYEKGADMIGWEWKNFNIPSSEKVTKVELKISSSKPIGKWQGAFGTSTTVKDDGYWAMSDDLEEKFTGNSGTITWNVPSSIANIIQYQYGGELKFGTWWVDSGSFNIDSIKVYTDGSSAPATTTTTTKTTTTTTTKATTTTTNTVPKADTATVWGDANGDGDVTIADAVLILQSLANPDNYKLTAQGRINADVIGNGDGVTASDALIIQQVEAGVYKKTDLPIK